MQSSIGKRRRIRGHKRARISASSGFNSRLTGIILLFAVFGCAHKEKKKSLKPFESLCLSGEGKGRIEYLEGRHVFSYESLNKSKENEWLLALSLPLQEEEVFTLGYEEALESKVQIKGKFYKRLTRAARKEKKVSELKQLKGVLGHLGIFLKTMNMVRIGDYPCKENRCNAGTKYEFTYRETANELQAKFYFDENHDFYIKARANSSYYRKINFVLQDKRRRPDARQPFSLFLIHRSCSKSI